MFKGEVLHNYLEVNKLSYAQFAEMIGVSKQMVYFLVRGLKQPSVNVLKIISEVTGIRMDELV